MAKAKHRPPENLTHIYNALEPGGVPWREHFDLWDPPVVQRFRLWDCICGWSGWVNATLGRDGPRALDCPRCGRPTEPAEPLRLPRMWG